jgi:putative FmdB family regulatory protein
MPTYAYTCTDCDHGFEQVQSFSDDALTVCPQCQGRLRKLFNAVGVVFKGSGFYKTDSRASSDTTKNPAPENGTSGNKEPTTTSANSEGKNKGNSNDGGKPHASGSSTPPTKSTTSSPAPATS